MARRSPARNARGVPCAFFRRVIFITGGLAMTSTYLSTHDLTQRFRCTSRTLFRRMKRPRNPFPAPCMRHAGSCNLWDSEEVAAWEQRERAYARMQDALASAPLVPSLIGLDQHAVLEQRGCRS